ncbi:hypothetical protein [Pseudonocardia sp. HH130630-07]|uniref:hypothetical protein n=1 Tax=Pseudonocardia sp. HH130630-07 TaxID=1690815 RepID=UPI0012E9F30A|nr:hypothetical protein [Pseudonocardia sp. HH130630-07]
MSDVHEDFDGVEPGQLGSSDKSHDDAGWSRYAAQLRATLQCWGYLGQQCWAEAVAAVPRHHLMTSPLGSDRAERVRGGELAALYDPRVWPGLVGLAWVLELLDTGVRPMRVLHVDADAYAVALLCHALGDRHVMTTSATPAHAETVSGALAACGWYPEVVVGAPGQQTALNGSYTAIVIPSELQISRACLAQLAPGGRAVVGPVTSATWQWWCAALLERQPDGAVFGRRVHDRRPREVDGRTVAYLVDHPDVLADLRRAHRVDSSGLCVGCTEDGPPAFGDTCPVRPSLEMASQQLGWR